MYVLRTARELEGRVEKRTTGERPPITHQKGKYRALRGETCHCDCGPGRFSEIVDQHASLVACSASFRTKAHYPVRIALRATYVRRSHTHTRDGVADTVPAGVCVKDAEASSFSLHLITDTHTQFTPNNTHTHSFSLHLITDTHTHTGVADTVPAGVCVKDAEASSFSVHLIRDKHAG